MKFSELIERGKDLIKFDAGTYYNHLDNCGCLTGMAWVALHGKEAMDMPLLRREFPFLTQKPGQTNYPVKLAGETSVKCDFDFEETISDLAFAVDQGKITFEQALGWIRANEPQDSAVKS